MRSLPLLGLVGLSGLFLGCAAPRGCPGAASGAPLDAAAVVEQVARGQVVVATAEEGFPARAEAERRFQALLGRLRAALGAPAPRAGQLVYRIPGGARGHQLTL